MDGCSSTALVVVAGSPRLAAHVCKSILRNRLDAVGSERSLWIVGVVICSASLSWHRLQWCKDPALGGWLCPGTRRSRAWDRVGLVDKQPADLRLFSRQGLSFWVCFIKTDVWVVGLGFRDIAEEKSY